MEIIKELELKRNTAIEIIEDEIAVNVIDRVISLMPSARKLYPQITGISSGMGMWYFDGKIEAEHEDGSGYQEFDLIEYIEDQGNTNSVWDLKVEINEAIIEIVELMNYFCSDLNYSTIIDRIESDKVVFYRDREFVSPFSSGTSEYLESSNFLKAIIEKGVKYEIRYNDEKKQISA